MPKNQYKKLKIMVEDILRNIPEARNSDIYLMVEIWRRYFPTKIKKGATGEEGIWLRDLYELPREDAIKRVRATFNHEGKYFPTEWKVAKQRGIKEDEWRQTLGYPVKSDTVHPTKGDSYMDQEHDFNSNKLFH